MKTHFAQVERGNESNPDDEWTDPLCNTLSDNLDVSNDWRFVSCKKCLNRQSQYKAEMKVAMDHNCKDMGEFVKFMEKYMIIDIVREGEHVKIMKTDLNYANLIDNKEANRVDDNGLSQGLWISFFWLLDQHSWAHPSKFTYYIDNIEEGEYIQFTYL